MYDYQTVIATLRTEAWVLPWILTAYLWIMVTMACSVVYWLSVCERGVHGQARPRRRSYHQRQVQFRQL